MNSQMPEGPHPPFHLDSGLQVNLHPFTADIFLPHFHPDRIPLNIFCAKTNKHAMFFMSAHTIHHFIVSPLSYTDASHYQCYFSEIYILHLKL